MDFRRSIFSSGRWYSELEQHGIYAAAEKQAKRITHPCHECFESGDRFCDDCNPQARWAEAHLEALQTFIEEIESASEEMKKHNVRQYFSDNWNNRGWTCRDFNCEHSNLVEFDNDYGQPVGYIGCQRFTCKHACEQVRGEFGQENDQYEDDPYENDAVINEIEDINWDDCPF